MFLVAMSGGTRLASRRVAAFLLIPVLCLSGLIAQAQTEKSNEQKKAQDDVVTLKTHLVSMEVMVKDKKGKFVTDLKAEDFIVSENGVRQQVEFLDPPLVGRSQPAQTSNANNAGTPRSAPRSGVPTNILSLILDGVTTDLVNLKQVREGTVRYIRERISDTDTVAVFGVSTDLRLLQPFTQDKEKLISAVENASTLAASNKNLEASQLAQDIERARSELESAGSVNLPTSPSAAAQGSSAAQALIAARALQQFTKLRSQLSAQQARPVLAALAAICDAQRSIPGKKTLVLFSQGFVTPQILDWQVQSVIDMANRANVAIYIVDSAGLRTSTPLSTSPVPDGPLAGVGASLSTEDRMRAVGGENVFDNVRHEGLNRQYDILYRISGDTGGEFIKGTNDLSKGLDRIDQEIRGRYTLSYYSTDRNFDGSFRKVKIEVMRPDLSVLSRSGYYANAEGTIALLSPDEKKLLATRPSIESNSAFPLFVELSPFRFKEGRYVVPLSIEMPPSAVKFERKGDKQYGRFNVLGVVREAPNKIIGRLGSDFDVALTEEQYLTIQRNNIYYRQDIELVPGTYEIEVIVRDRATGKMAAKSQKLSLTAGDTEFSASGIVLSRFAEPAKPNAPESVDVLNHGGAQIRPLPSRQFRPSDNLIIFFELYNAGVNAEMKKPLVRVTVTLMKDDKVAMRPIDYVLTDATAQPFPHVTFSKYIKLAGLEPGNYIAMIDATDMVSHKTVKNRLPFVLTK